MLCPVCKSTELKMADRQGVEIDYCPTCRGVWLDRGELDKIIERSAIPVGSSSRQDHEAREKREYRSEPERPTPRRDYDDDDRQPQYGKKKKRGFLDELFDF